MLLLEANDSIMFRLNTADFDESLVYSGSGAKKNNFLIKTFLENEIDNKKLTKYCQMEPEYFMKHVDSAMDKVTDTDNSMIAKLVRACGRESGIALTMSIDSILAGIDTTGSSGASLLYHLADNPEKQEKLHEEICSVLGPRGEVNEAGLGKMRYLKACQTESQRMANASFATSRRLQVYKTVSRHCGFPQLLGLDAKTTYNGQPS